MHIKTIITTLAFCMSIFNYGCEKPPVISITRSKSDSPFVPRQIILKSPTVAGSKRPATPLSPAETPLEKNSALKADYLPLQQQPQPLLWAAHWTYSDC